MRCALRPSLAGETGAGRAVALAIAIVFALAVGTIWPAQAQIFPSPQPTPTPGITIISSDISVGQTVTNQGSNFLERLANQASNGVNRIGRTNPGGGGASEASEAPKFRAWMEAYGLTSSTDLQGDFAGDRRKTLGGVVGIGATVAPGINVGFSVDQSHSRIDVPLAFQFATLDLTQVGANFSIDKGPWTIAGAAVHGWGAVNSNRYTDVGLTNLAIANYGARVDGVLGEINYYWTKDQFRVVPKLGIEYVHSSTGAFTEQGQTFFLVSASNATAERARVLAGAEVGRYWIFDQKVFDLSAYGKFIDNFHQAFSTVMVSIPGFQPVSVQGIGESRYGADAGAAASLSVTNNLRFYARYDGKFREQFRSHQGTAGVEIRW